ncbi:hypothetical protein SO802_001460 [Lithocarpus litseifolius]|uniref:Reverse transcriptase domain-containing protein n=1 Tax=Lithocarpus litseifolius TaxID=425828 RepID=A0AAW2E055_9ROSI
MTNPQNTLPPPTETVQALDFNLNTFQNNLAAFPSIEEIRTTLWSIHPQKAPGPDWLHAQFFQHSWGTLSRDISKFIQTIFITGRVPHDLTAVKLILIPKVTNPEMVHQLRPINLCNTLYKLLSKIIVLRLKKFLPNLVHPTQSGFIPRRRATDNYIIAQEMIHLIHNKRGQKGLMAAKIDLEKSYDRLEWAFIRFTLQFFNFPKQIIDLIMACLETSSISVMWNGQISKPFNPSRGDCQGDPLSPYLFILCLNHLSLLLDSALHTKTLQPIKVNRRDLSFNHIFFADDIFLFAHANPQQTYILFNIFGDFCNNSGQLFSPHKSKLFFSRNTPEQIQNDIAAQINIPIVEDLGKYLGLPILTSRKLNSTFSPLIERINSKVRLWHPKLLSMAGRLTLIKSVLTPILNYHMQTTLLPAAVILRLEQVLKGEDQTKVSDVLAPNSQWDLNPLSFELPISIMKQIQATPISDFNVSQDKLIWSSHAGVHHATEFFYLSKHPKLQHQTSITTFVGWKPTPFPFLTLNTDGSSKGNTGHARAGGIIRNHWGKWIGGFSINIGITHSMMTELWAIREGLKYAWNKGYKYINLQVDSKMAHNWITNLNSLVPLEYSNLILDCRSLLERPWAVKTNHIWREANRCADLLAKKGVDQSEREIFYDTCPAFLTQCYFWDSLGFTSPRLVGCTYQGN